MACNNIKFTQLQGSYWVSFTLQKYGAARLACRLTLRRQTWSYVQGPGNSLVSLNLIRLELHCTIPTRQSTSGWSCILGWPGASTWNESEEDSQFIVGLYEVFCCDEGLEP